MTTDTEAGFEGLVGFKDELERIRAAITEFESGQKTAIAIIGEPFAGRTTLAHAVEQMTARKVTKLLFSSLIKTNDAVQLPEESRGIVIVDHCQFLFTRTIGGFDILEQFLKTILASDNLFITTWNLYAWNYLDEVLSVGQYFPVQLMLPKFTTQETKELINYYSNGNPGVAKVLWETSLQYPAIKPSYIKECSFKIELDYTEAFILYCILATEAITREELVALSGGGAVDKVLARLRKQDLITVAANEHYGLNPEALNCIVGYLKKAGVIW
jgi:hypothetical protein